MNTSVHIDPYKKILLVGGGSGGHFYPLIAIAEEFNTHTTRPELYYAGPDEYDSEALRAEGIQFISISSGKHRRYNSFLNFLDIFKVAYGTCVALVKLFILYPDVVVSKGGYTSVPVVFAAGLLRIPIIVHESDSVLGKANKFALHFAQHIITAYEHVRLPETKAQQHTLGIPIRKVLHGKASTSAISLLNINPDKPVILVIGGSQGAERVNALILDSLDELLADYTIIHQTGKVHYENCVQSAKILITNEEWQKNYHPVAFLNAPELNDAYHLASLIISRAGSGSIYEIALHGKPSILIPIPEEISHDQHSNAYAYARSGATQVIEEKNLSDDLLSAEIERIMQDSVAYTAMATAAQSFGEKHTTREITDLITHVSIEH